MLLHVIRKNPRLTSNEVIFQVVVELVLSPTIQPFQRIDSVELLKLPNLLLQSLASPTIHLDLCSPFAFHLGIGSTASNELRLESQNFANDVHEIEGIHFGHLLTTLDRQAIGIEPRIDRRLKVSKTPFLCQLIQSGRDGIALVHSEEIPSVPNDVHCHIGGGTCSTDGIRKGNRVVEKFHYFFMDVGVVI